MFNQRDLLIFSILHYNMQIKADIYHQSIKLIMSSEPYILLSFYDNF